MSKLEVNFNKFVNYQTEPTVRIREVDTEKSKNRPLSDLFPECRYHKCIVINDDGSRNIFQLSMTISDLLNTYPHADRLEIFDSTFMC